MNMKVIFNQVQIILLVFLVSVSLNAQVPKVVQGPLISSGRNAQSSNIVAVNSNGFVTLRTPSSLGDTDFFIDTYDNALALKKSVEIKWELNGQRVKTVNAYVYQDTIFVTGSGYNMAKKSWFTITKTFDPVTGIFKDVNTKADNFERPSPKSTQYIVQWISLLCDPIKLPTDPSTIVSALSPDSMKRVVIYPVFNVSGVPDKFHAVAMLANQQTTIFESDLTFPYQKDLFFINRQGIANDGTIYFLGIVFEEEIKSNMKESPNYKYVLYSYPPGSDEGQLLELTAGSKFITDMGMKILPNGDVVLAGLVSDKGEMNGNQRGVVSSTNGMVFFYVDGATQSLKATGLKEFDEQMISQFRKSERESGELFAFNIDKIHISDDGNVIVCAEQQNLAIYQSLLQTPMYGTSSAVNNGAMRSGTSTQMVSTVTFDFNSIIAACISPDGTFQWCVTVPKKQSTSTDAGLYSSFASCVEGEKLYLVFNDNPKNLALAPGEKPAAFNGDRSSVVLVTIDANGNASKSQLFTNRGTDAVFCPRTSAVVANSGMLLYSVFKDDFFYTRLTFK